MEPNFEIRYLSLKWHDKENVSSLKVGDIINPSAEIESPAGYRYDLYAYKRLDDGPEPAQPGLAISDPALKPYWLSSGQKIALRRVTDPVTKKNWWIEDGEWVSRKDQEGRKWGYVRSLMWNTSGTAELEIGGLRCILNIHAMKPEAWQTILDEFKRELRVLIHSPESYVGLRGKDDEPESGDSRPARGAALLDERLAKLLAKYLGHINNIIKRPTKRLHEIQSQKPLMKLKPVTKTFVEFAANPSRSKYTAKNLLESYDTPENRYIGHTLKIVNIIVSSTQKFHNYLLESLLREKADCERRLNEIGDQIQINKKAFLNHLKMMETNYAAWQEKAAQAMASQTEKELRFAPVDDEITLKSQSKNKKFWYGYFTNPYTICFDPAFAPIIKPGDTYEILAHQYDPGDGSKGIMYMEIASLNKPTYGMDLPKDDKFEAKVSEAISRQTPKNPKLKGKPKPFRIVVHKRSGNNLWLCQMQNNFYFELEFDNILYPESTYQISAHIAAKVDEQKPNNYIWNITKIVCLSKENELKTLRKEKEKLEKNAWKRPPDENERKERNRDKAELKRKINSLEQQMKKYEVQDPIKKNIGHLARIGRNFSIICPKTAPDMPPSMSFLENPDYRGTHSSFMELKKLLLLDDKMLDILGRVEHIGILEIPKVYERWCLLQVIKMIGKFGFTSVDGWSKKLLVQLIELKKKKNIRLSFTHDISGWNIELWHEKELPNKKRPDLVLELFTLDQKNRKKGHTLVMDAKYYENSAEIWRALEELCEKKDYSQNDHNHVFVLHPYHRAIPDDKILSGQIWSEHSFYGEGKMFEWEKMELNEKEQETRKHPHQYGIIRLSPVVEHGVYTHNLQRLIGMFLQYPFYRENGKKEIENKKNYFCLTCGGGNYTSTKAQTIKKRDFYYITCLDCGHRAILTHCARPDCATDLFKHGSYWSYHRAEPHEPYNVSCPRCNFRF